MCCMEVGQSSRFTKCIDVNCACLRPGRILHLRFCTDVLVHSSAPLRTCCHGAGIAKFIFVFGTRCSLSVAMEVLATSTIASVFTVMCSCLQSLLSQNAKENFGHFQKSPVAQKKEWWDELLTCACTMWESAEHLVFLCARVVIFWSLFNRFVAQVHVCCSYKSTRV